MKKKRVLLILILLTLIISIISLALVTIHSKTKSDIEIKEDKSLITKIQSKVSNSNYLDLNTVTDFKWDKVYIVTPYSILKTIFEENKIKPANIDKSIETLDNINLVVFTLNKTIVAYVNLPRNIGDFYFQRYMEFDKSVAVFNIAKDKNGIKLSPRKQ